MKPLHKIGIDSDPKFAWSKFIHVKGGFVYTGNSKCFVKFPAHEVFGKGVITADEELYFYKHNWQIQKFEKAVSFKREGELFEAVDKKGNQIGIIKAIEGIAVKQNNEDYPNLDSQKSDDECLMEVGVAPGNLKDIAEVLGDDVLRISRNSMDIYRPHLITSINLDSLAYAVSASAEIPFIIKSSIAPKDSGEEFDELVGYSQNSVTEGLLEEAKIEIVELKERLLEYSSFKQKIEELESEIRGKDSEIEELEELTRDVREVDFGGTKLSYKCDNLQLEEVLAEVIECMKTMSPKDFLTELQTIQMLQ